MKISVKSFLRLIVISCAATASGWAVAEDLSVGSIEQGAGGKNSEKLNDLAKFLKNLGMYLGYDLEKMPSEIAGQLIDYSDTGINEMYAYNSMLGAIPVDVINTGGSPYQNYSYFLPTQDPLAASINPQWNFAFRNPAYNAPNAGSSGSVVANALLDQASQNQQYMLDPVSQAVYNLLATPDDTFCMDWQNENYDKNCALLTQSRVMANIVGQLPGGNDYFTFNYNKYFMDQLNANNLLAPLLYSTEVKAPANNQVSGLLAYSQAQLANNFVLYATGQVTPIKIIDKKSYSNLYQQTTSTDYNTRINSKATLAKYFARLRTYVARYSIGISNIYSILAKRMPQNLSGQTDQNTSQANEEFKMATWRLFKQSANGGSSTTQKSDQWLTKINTASAATVQKEIAVLLAEINYQLYLTRQQQERLLLVDSANMLLTNIGTLPDISSSSNDGSDSSTSSNSDLGDS